MSQLVSRSLTRRLQWCRNAMRSRSGTVAAGITAVAVAGLFAACSPDQSIKPSPKAVPDNGPSFVVSPSEGEDNPGQCMQADVEDAGFISNIEGNCVSNDIDIAQAEVTLYRYALSGEGSNFLTLNEGEKIPCSAGQTVYVTTSAVIENNAQARYDVGLWIGINGVDARTGTGGTGTCNHYHLVPGQGGSVSLDASPDQCGDVSANTDVEVPLGELAITCTDDPNISGLQVTISACAGWLNSTSRGSTENVCPIPTIGDLGDAYRFGTTQETPSKCKCNPLTLPIDIKAALTLVKTVTNDNGGTATVASFPLTAAGPTPFSGVSGTTAVTARAVNAGTYALSEQTVAGYTPSSWTCTGNGTQSGANITLAAAGAATCTINNNDVAPTLTLVKTVTNNDGGTLTVANFPLTATGPVTINGVSGTTSVTARPVSAGQYVLSEATQAGYTASSWTCTGGTQNGTSVTLALGGAATCTINNNDNPAGLTLVKIVTNDNGGTATVANFPLTATGPVTISGVSGTTSVTARPVSAGQYALSEQTVAGYTPSSWTCTGGTQSGANITLGTGGSATCSIINNDVAPTLTLVKTVTNDNGGTLTVANFPLTATGPVTINGVSGTTSVTARPVSAGQYVLSEATQAGYTASSWTCTGGTQNGTSVTLALGGAATCTINNNDNAATLTIVKRVIGDGATFAFTSGSAGIDANFSLSPLTDATAQKVFTGLSAGSKSVTETLNSNYTLTDLGCTRNGSAVGGPYDPLVTQTVTVNLTLGDNVICTFVNQQKVGATTRTQGFWQTHLSILTTTWNSMSLADRTLCGQVLTVDDVLGGFWANIAQTSDHEKRSDIDQAKMRLLQQLLAAMLNHQAFGSSPTGSISIAQAKTIFCTSTSLSQINAAAAAMAAFNESGDNEEFTPGASANAKAARAAADIDFWDNVP